MKSGRLLTRLYKPLLLGAIWGLGIVGLPDLSWAYLPRYVHVTLGLPWFAYLFFLLGVLVPVFLYLGISWYFKRELEQTGHGKGPRDEDSEE
ncbi:MAG: hypothetical protein M1313_03535 [Nitrospirae bacterium]|nr:hypothetical protein [Nitrospirota bacterium]